MASATLTNLHTKTHDGIAVDSGNPFDGTDAGTLCQCSDDRDFLVRAEYVRHDCLTTITVPQKLQSVKMFLGYNYRIMLKYLGIAAILVMLQVAPLGPHAQAQPTGHPKTTQPNQQPESQSTVITNIDNRKSCEKCEEEQSVPQKKRTITREKDSSSTRLSRA
jgi:hypothetical protein